MHGHLNVKLSFSINTNQPRSGYIGILTSYGDRIVIVMTRICRVRCGSGIVHLGGEGMGVNHDAMYSLCFNLKVHCSINTQAIWYVCNMRLSNWWQFIFPCRNNFWMCRLSSLTQSQSDITTAAGHLPYHFAKLCIQNRLEFPLNVVRFTNLMVLWAGNN